MSQGPDLPRPIYPDGQPPAPAGQPAPEAEGPSSDRPATTSPAPTPRSTSGSASGGSNPMKLLLIGLVAVAVIAGAGFGLLQVLGGDDDSSDGRGDGGDPTGEVSAEATQAAADALDGFPESAQECLAVELDQDADLLSALAPVASDFGFTFDDPAIAESYADAMAGCVDRDDLADNLAASAGTDTAADCVRENVAAWSDGEARDFIRDSVDASRVSVHNDNITSLLTC